MKLGIGTIAAGGYAHAIPIEFYRSIRKLQSALLREQLPFVTSYVFLESHKFPTDVARNDICRMALEERCDKLLFLDVDQVFEPVVIHRLLQAEKDIITARYHVKRPPYHPTLYVVPTANATPGQFKPVHYGKGLFTVDRCGAGGLLVSRAVLEQCHDPWFAYQRDPDPPHDMAVSEDFWFCQQAINQGFKIWADWDAEMGHIVTGVVTGEWFEQHLEVLKAKDPAAHARLVRRGNDEESHVAVG